MRGRDGPDGRDRHLSHAVRPLPGLRRIPRRPARGRWAPYSEVTGARGVATAIRCSPPAGHTALTAYTRPFRTERGPGSGSIDRYSTDHQTHCTRPSPLEVLAEAPAARMPPPAAAFPPPLAPKIALMATASLLRIAFDTPRALGSSVVNWWRT